MQIRVSPDILRNVAEQQGIIVDTIAEETTKISDLINQMGEAWQGASGAQAQNALEEIRIGIKKIVDGAVDCTQKLMSVADAFESIDNGESILAVRKFSTWAIPLPIRPVMTLSIPGMVSIDPDRVRDIAEQCKHVSVSISENTSAFSSNIKDLSDNWEGRSYVKYEDEARQVINALQEIEEVMAEYISRIENAANRYEEIDNSL